MKERDRARRGGKELFLNLGFNTTRDMIHKRKEIHYVTSYNILLSAWILHKVHEGGIQADHRISGN